MTAESFETMIDEALMNHLTRFVFEPISEIQSLVAYPNKPFTPVAGKPHLRITNLHSQTVPAGYGDEADNYHTGVFVINVFYPENKGTTEPGDLVGALIAHFKRGTAMPGDDITVHVDGPPWRSPPLQPPQWYQLGINIPWYCYAPNPA